MAVTYKKEVKDKAKEDGKHLITMEVPGLFFQGAVDDEERDQLNRYILDFLDRRRKKLAAAKTS